MADNDQDTDVNDAEDLGAALLEESTSTTESSTEENKETDKAADKPAEKPADPADEPDTDAAESDTDDDAADDPEAAEQPPKKDAEARKAQLNQEIRELVARKKDMEQQVNEAIAANYRTETPEELQSQGYEREDAEKLAQEQAREMEQFNREVVDTNQRIDLEVAQLMSDFAWADKDSPDYDAASAERAYKLYETFAQPQIDPKTGYVTKTNAFPYDIYASFDAERQAARESGTLQGQKATEKMLAAAEPQASSSRTGKTDKEDEDPFMAGFNKVI
jgi:hypothetical protein